MNPFGVVSFDPNRVWVEENGKVVAKKTEYKEVVQLASAEKKLKKANLLLWGKKHFAVKVPEILSWDTKSGVLRQSFCLGDNLELALRSCSGRERLPWVELIGCLLRWMKRNGFFWQGLAPRHVLIDHARNTVSLMDFERDFHDSAAEFSEEEFNILLRGAVHEELCAFLFQGEQDELFANLWEKIPSGVIQWADISSTRQKLLIKHLFSKWDCSISHRELATAQKFLANIVTPFYIGTTPFFPLLELDNIRGAQNYVEAILEISTQERRIWPDILKTRGSVRDIRAL